MSNYLPLSGVSFLFGDFYFEDVIPGYKTNSVTGRHDVLYTINALTIGNRPGTVYQNRTRGYRSLNIGFVILAKTKQELFENINKLKTYDTNTETKICFLDDPNVYYIGVIERISMGELSVRNTYEYQFAVSGSFAIYCSDPFKYSVYEKTASSDNGVFTIENNGSEDAYLTIESKMTSTNGYLGISINDNVYQLGKLENLQTESEKQSVTLFNESLYKDRGWSLNGGVTPPVTETRLQIGTVGYTQLSGEEGYVQPTSYGDDQENTIWHGPSLTKTIPTDADGLYPVNWKATYVIDFNPDGVIERAQQLGHQSMTFVDEDGNIIVSVVFEDIQNSIERTQMVVYIGNERIWEQTALERQYSGATTVVVEKIDDVITVSFSIANISKTFTAVSKTKTLRKVTWYAAKLDAWPNIRNNILRSLSVVKHYVDSQSDIPNPFNQNDIVVIDSKENTVTVNNVTSLDLISIGSIPPTAPKGLSSLVVAHSSFSSEPITTIKYRERWK